MRLHALEKNLKIIAPYLEGCELVYFHTQHIYDNHQTMSFFYIY